MSGAKKNGAPEEVQLKIVLEHTEDTPVYYVNFAEVGHSQYEFFLSATRIPTKLNPEVLKDAKKEGVLKLEPTLQLLLPPRVIPGLIQALQVQLKSFENKVGPASKDSEGE